MSNLTFGVELETVINLEAARDRGITVGEYHVGNAVPNMPGWTAQRDGSIAFGGRPNGGAEFVSPKLMGAEGIAQIRRMTDLLHEIGGKVNSSCGVHVHVGLPDGLTDIQREAAINRIAALVSSFEMGLIASTGSRSRLGNNFCRPVKEFYRAAFEQGRTLDPRGDRYRSLNLVPLRVGRRQAVEFRVFAGSVNPTKITAWVLLCLGIVERALSNAPRVGWDMSAVQSSLARRTPGRTQLEALMRTLGWTQEASSTRRRFGLGPVGGRNEDVMPFVKELRRLAKKFDGVPGATGPARRRRVVLVTEGA